MPAVLAAQQNDDLRTARPRQNHAPNRKLGEDPRPRSLLEAAEPIERSDTNLFVFHRSLFQITPTIDVRGLAHGC